MKTSALILLTTLLLAGHAKAQYTTPQQRARNVSGKMTEQQNTAAQTDPFAARYGTRSPAPAPGAPAGTPLPAAAPVAPAPPVKPSAQQLAANKLKADIGEARGKGEITTDMRKQFVTDLNAVAQGRNRPSSGSVTRFGESLLTSLAGKSALAAEDTKLVKALVVSFNSAGLPAARLQELNAEVRGVLTKSGVSTADATLVGENLAAVVSDIQSLTPN